MEEKKKQRGRVPGSLNKSTEEVRCFVDKVFRFLEEKHGISPHGLACKLLTSENPQTVASVFKLLLEYRYGKPMQPVEHSGPGANQFVWDIPVSARIQASKDSKEQVM